MGLENIIIEKKKLGEKVLEIVDPLIEDTISIKWTIFNLMMKVYIYIYIYIYIYLIYKYYKYIYMI